MDLPPLQQLTNALGKSLNANNVLDLSRFPAGTRLLASVANVIKVDDALRQQFLSLSQTLSNTPKEKALADRSQSPSPPQTINQLIQQRNVQAVQLSVLGKSQWVFTQAALTPKQKIPVIVRGDGQLQIQPKSSSVNRDASSPSTALAQGVRGKDAPPTTLQNLTREQFSASRTTEILSEGLRHHLPKQAKVSDLVALTQQILVAVKSQGNDKKLLDLMPIFNRLIPLIVKSPRIEQLVKAESLKNAIANSGVFLEGRLAKNTEQRTQPNLHVATTHIPSSRAGQEKPLATRAFPQDDFKAEILGAIESLRTAHIPRQGQPQNTNLDKLIQSLFSFFPNSNTTQKSEGIHSAHARFIAQLQPILLSALSRISVLQLQHILQNQQDPNRSLGGGFLELPVRIGDHVYPLLLHIQEHPVQEKHEKDELKKSQQRDHEVKKRWQVYLEFDLDELGIFASEVSVLDQHVSTKFWVQKENLWSKTQDHLTTLKNDLEKSGIEVDDIFCYHSEPPEKSIEIKRSLVDVRT